MLPESRQQEYLFNVPKFDLTTEDVEEFREEPEAFHARFADCFQRVESRKNFLRYMTGQFGRLERKSIEPIARAAEGGKARAMQRFVSAAPWDDQKMLAKYQRLMVRDLGHPDGILVFDETAFVKRDCSPKDR
jgi:SRSO17 transposase